MIALVPRSGETPSRVSPEMTVDPVWREETLCGSARDSQGDAQGREGQWTVRIKTDEIHVKNHGNKDFFLQRVTMSLDP